MKLPLPRAGAVAQRKASCHLQRNASVHCCAHTALCYHPPFRRFLALIRYLTSEGPPPPSCSCGVGRARLCAAAATGALWRLNSLHKPSSLGASSVLPPFPLPHSSFYSFWKSLCRQHGCQGVRRPTWAQLHLAPWPLIPACPICLLNPGASTCVERPASINQSAQALIRSDGAPLHAPGREMRFIMCMACRQLICTQSVMHRSSLLGEPLLSQASAAD